MIEFDCAHCGAERVWLDPRPMLTAPLCSICEKLFEYLPSRKRTAEAERFLGPERFARWKKHQPEEPDAWDELTR